MEMAQKWIFVTIFVVCIPSKVMSSKRCYYNDGNIRGYCQEEMFSSPGIVRFAASVGVHSPRDDHSCGDISTTGVQTAMAVRWIVDILNGMGDFSKAFIQGISIGLYY